MPSPTRRSTRAGPAPSRGPGAPSISSSSSHASSRIDRKTNGLTKSTTPYSRSSEEASEPPRRSQRSQPVKEDMSADLGGRDEINADEEEEVTRCICGQPEYPGPPQSEAFRDVDIHSEDAGGLFIQCDGCSVWQHGGCVGIIEESQSPDKYYCEECRPKLHDLHIDSRGQKYSLYRPLHPKTARKGSMSKGDEKARKEREALLSRASTDPITGKRRATMRSKEHDDEEEQLRRALEESRREVEGQPNGKKHGKRGRDDSEDKQDIKRLRKASGPTPSLRRADSQEVESDVEGADGINGRARRARQDLGPSARQAELKEKESEREKMRQEAAGRRQERAGRRRGDEALEESEEISKTTETIKGSPPRSSQPPTPPPSTTIEKMAPKRGPGRRGKKLGNNQYTKARDHAGASSPPAKRREAGISSGDEQAGPVDAAGSNGASKNSPVRETNGGTRGGRFGKGRFKVANTAHKSDEPVERTFTNMKRSLDMMMAFVSRQQIDMAGDRTPVQSDGPTSHPLSTGGAVQAPDSNVSATSDTERPFEQRNAMEMADVFSRNVEKWNRLYAHLA